MSRRGSLKGSVSKRNDKWRARYWDDKGRQHSRTFTKKGHAEAWLRRELDDLHNGVRHPAAVTVADYTDRWLARAQGEVRPSSYSFYEGLCRVHITPTLGRHELRDLTPEVVRAWYSDLRVTPKHGKEGAQPLSRSTCAKAYRLLKRICADAVDDGLAETNPCRIKGASTEPDYVLSYEEPPTAEEVRALAAAVPSRYKTMVLLAGFGGLRWGEVAGLQRRHIDLGAATVRVNQQLTQVDGGRPTIGPPKTAAGMRTVYVHGEVAAALRTHLAEHTPAGPDGFLFTSPNGALLRASNFRRNVWLPATTAVGRPGRRFHDLRHAAATFAALTGASTKDLMARMGHRSQAAAVRYQHATRAQQAAIAQKLDEMLTIDAEANVVPTRRVR